MSPRNVLIGDELREIARSLFGWEWAEQVADALKMDRKDLVRIVASNEPVSRETTEAFVHLAEVTLQKKREELSGIAEQVKQRLRKLD